MSPEQMKVRMLEISVLAEEAFWDKVAELAREAPFNVSTGDLPPEAVYRFNAECQRVVEQWLMWNMQLSEGR